MIRRDWCVIAGVLPLAPPERLPPSKAAVCERYAGAPPIGRGPRPRRRVSPRAPLRRQPPLSARADARLDANGSSPVSNLNATGICRRRGTPSFCRSASQCAFAVLGEMPRACPTSSFDSPCAINSITSRCREVMPEESRSACMAGRLRCTGPTRYRPKGVSRRTWRPGARSATRRGRLRVRPCRR